VDTKLNIHMVLRVSELDFTLCGFPHIAIGLNAILPILALR